MKYSKDGKIRFDETWHTYTNIETSKRLKGVTSLIGQYKNKFDAELVATQYAEKTGQDKNALLLEWSAKGQASIDNGHAVHKVFEDYTNTGQINLTGNYPKEQVAVKFINEVFKTDRLTPVEAEMIIYNESIASQIDCIAKDRENRYYILDWKTNSKIETEGYNKFMLSPFDNYPDASYYHYSLQLRIYKKLCTEYDINDLFIVHIDETDYNIMRCADFVIPDYVLGLKQLL